MATYRYLAAGRNHRHVWEYVSEIHLGIHVGPALNISENPDGLLRDRLHMSRSGDFGHCLLRGQNGDGTIQNLL
jgi:hypothetical protein